MFAVEHVGRRPKGAAMYIGGGVILVILIVLLVLFLTRRGAV